MCTGLGLFSLCVSFFGVLQVDNILRLFRLMPLLKIFKLLLRFWNSVGMGLPVFGDPLLVSFFGI
jgi:hypothetical protein